MANFPSDHMTARSGRDAWMQDNERGLALATDGDWTEASEAFAAAADSLARTLPADPRSTHEPLALVLSNLAQAYFRCGRLDDAMQQAQRACALRVAIAGEDGMPVARARMDLAVMLATAGRLEEATALVQRSISAIEHRVGEEDARLAIVLENAARIALAAGQPANAEPLLIRLHALLDAHELSTARAEALLGRVAAVRVAQQTALAASTPAGEAVVAADIESPAARAAAAEFESEVAVDAAAEVAAEPAEHATDVATDVAIEAAADAPSDVMIETVVPTPLPTPSFDDDAAARVYAHASIAEIEEWEDQPLRDAVAVTDVLLRTTPSGVPIIPAPPVVEPPRLELTADTAEEADALLDTMDLTDVLPAPSLREPDADQLLSVAPTPTSDLAIDLDLAFDDVGTSDSPLLDALDMVEFAPTASSTSIEPAPALEPTAAPVDPVDVALPPTVGGLTLDFAVEHGMISDDEPILQGPPVSMPVPDALEVVPPEPAPPAIASVTQIVSAGATSGISPIADIVQTAPVMEPTAPARPAPEPEPRPERRTSEARVVTTTPAASGGKSTLIAIIAGVVVVGGGAAAFFLLR